ncbi:MAG: Gfo/Idh/MocA family oxidoreductase [Oscillospiraceae bacterium]|nr:Gfo/Idh/MocA family oxidoreductase [Oscillospiraceae bacterium]
MSKKIRIGVIGCGGMSNAVHMPSLASIEDCEIAAVCDLVKEKADAAAAKYNVPHTYYLHTDLIREEAGKLDGVVCFIEPDRVYRVVYDCLQGGLNVMMEKPAGINSYQADSLARCAAENNKVLAVALNRRYMPLIQEVVRIMKDMGPINQVDGVFIKHSDVTKEWHYMDAYISDIIHATDLVRYLAGGEKVVKAATIAKKINSPVLNAWSSVFSFDNGVTGTLRANYQTSSRVHTFEIHGENASAYINLGFADQICEATIMAAVKGSIYSRAVSGYAAPTVTHLDGLEIAGGDQYYQYYGYLAENQDFVAALREGRKPFCTIEDAALSMHMAEDLLAAQI